MTQILLLPLLAYAACGLLLSLAVHLLSFVDLQPGGKTLFILLHIGIFPLALPIALIAMKMTRGVQRRDYWKAVLSGCPNWMKYMTYGFFIYAIANFVIFMFIAPTGTRNAGSPPGSVWRGFSGHWMAFYSVGLAILWTAYSRGLSNLERRCANGHAIGFSDRFCPTCGVPIAAPDSSRRVLR